MVVIGRSETNASSLAAPAYERWLKSFRFLYDLNGTPTPPNLPLTFDAAIYGNGHPIGNYGSSWLTWCGSAPKDASIMDLFHVLLNPTEHAFGHTQEKVNSSAVQWVSDNMAKLFMSQRRRLTPT